MITTKNPGNSHSFRYYSVHFPSNRGIATPACALARNDSAYLMRTFKHQFTVPHTFALFSILLPPLRHISRILAFFLWTIGKSCGMIR